MSEVGPPTAEGDLGQTPFSHLVVYALERKLTGTLRLEETPERIHTLTFVRGAPAKLRPADEFLRLGRLLTEEGLIDDATLEGALSTQGLLGDVLVMAGHVEPDALERALDRQFRMRFVRCFTFDPATRYRYYEGLDDLAEWGAEPTRIDPYELLWSGLERHGDKASSMEPTLAALSAEQPLAIHARAPLERLALEGQAAEVVELLLLEPTSFPELIALEVATPDLIRRVIFALLLLRCLDLGKGALPVGVNDRAPTTLARVQLKQSVQRLVAAAPDEVGDGERIQRKARRDPRQDSMAPGAPDEPASGVPESPRGPISSEPSGELISGERLTASGELEAREPASRAAPETTKSPGPGAPTPPTAPKPATPKLAPPPPATKPQRPKDGAADSPGKALASKDPEKAPVDGAARTNDPGGKPPGVKPGSAAAKPAPSATAKPVKSADLDDSSVRTIRSALAGKPISELLSAARARIEAKDADAALELAEAAHEREPSLVDALLLVTYAKSLRPHADLKTLSIQLDEVVGANEAHADARYYRACLRKRLGDDAGAKRDFAKALELDPEHTGAIRDAAVLAASSPSDAAKRSGLLGRLFRR